MANPTQSIEEKEYEHLKDELEQFRREKERIRSLIGQIGGVKGGKREMLINIGFVAMIVGLFAMDTAHHFFEVKIPIPSMFSLELGVLLVSIKIIWMIHQQTRVEHFQFWILNTIEFRLGDIANRVRRLEESFHAAQSEAKDD